MPTPPEIQIEAFTPPLVEDDFEALVTLRQQLSLTGAPADPATLRRNIDEMYCGNQTYPFVARDVSREGLIVGTTVGVSFVTFGARKIWFEDVVVDENYRRQGIGGALASRCLDLARELELDTVGLTSNRKREAAHGLYAKLGFSEPDTTLLTRSAHDG